MIHSWIYKIDTFQNYLYSIESLWGIFYMWLCFVFKKVKITPWCMTSSSTPII